MPLVKITVPCAGMVAGRALTTPPDRPVMFAGEPVGQLVGATPLDDALELEVLLGDAGLEVVRAAGYDAEEVPWAEA